MAIEGPGRAAVPSLTSLPSFEDLPRVGDGLDARLQLQLHKLVWGPDRRGV